MALQDLSIDDARVDWIVDTKIASCLDAKGLEGSKYLAIAPSRLDPYDESSPQSTHSFSGLLEQLSTDVARESGYATVQVHRTDLATLAELPEGFSTALSDPDSPMASVEVPGLGVLEARTGGCIATANAQVYGSVERWLLAKNGVVSGLRQFSSDALASQEVVTSAALYAACMEVAGYATGNPAQSAAIARDTWYTDEVREGQASAAEIAMAVADAECQVEHPVLAVAEAVTLQNAGHWIDANAGLIAEAAAGQREALRVAARETARE